MPNLKKRLVLHSPEELAIELLHAQEAHHKHEVKDLGGISDPNWRKWYADFMFGRYIARHVDSK
jgi:hypothetical protein